MIKRIWNVLDSKHKSNIIKLQFLIVCGALFELVGIASVGALMSLVGDLESIYRSGFWGNVYVEAGLTDKYDFLFLIGLVVLFILTTASIVSLFVAKFSYSLSARIGVSLSERLYRFYMGQPWLFHSKRNSADFFKNISTEAIRVNNGIIQPMLEINSKLVMIVIFGLSFFIYNPSLSIVFVFLFFLLYLLIFRLAKEKVRENSANLSNAYSKMFKLMNEGFGGIKEIIVYDLGLKYKKDFLQCTGELSKAVSDNNFMANSPRYLVELIAFGTVIVSLLVMLKTSNGSLDSVLPTISVLAFGGLKLLPALQGVYTGISHIKGHSSSFLSIEDDLKEAVLSPLPCNIEGKKRVAVDKGISLRNVYFSYTDSSGFALSGVSLDIAANNTIGIIGSSGSGKSTLVDCILRLIDPQKGEILIDGKDVSKRSKDIWAASVGYVPQSIYLSDSSIIQNVAFGCRPDEINEDKVKQVVKMAHAEEFIKNLPDGLSTKVGERGVQLSGGQRQRVGIARALYFDPSVLIFDEATSALDSVSEREVMNAISDLSGKKTIIMIAHRMKTIESCDYVYLMDKGVVADKGTFHELRDRSEFLKAGLQNDNKDGE